MKQEESKEGLPEYLLGRHKVCHIGNCSGGGGGGQELATSQNVLHIATDCHGLKGEETHYNLKQHVDVTGLRQNGDNIGEFVRHSSFCNIHLHLSILQASTVHSGDIVNMKVLDSLTALATVCFYILKQIVSTRTVDSDWRLSPQVIRHYDMTLHTVKTLLLK